MSVSAAFVRARYRVSARGPHPQAPLPSRVKKSTRFLQPSSAASVQCLSTSPSRCVEGRRLNNQANEDSAQDYDRAIAGDKKAKTPWHRQGSDLPPVHRQRSAGAMTKGKLLTTPSRLLKLVLPLTTRDMNSDRKDIEPLALVVHPNQPLSYLERLIQSELPVMKGKDGKEKIPAVWFKADASSQGELGQRERRRAGGRLEKTKIDGKTEETGILNRKSQSKARAHEEQIGDGQVESYSGHGQDAPKDKDSKDGDFVRWSGSTEIGDFIRDAARGREFAVAIESAPDEIRVGVPSFNDRTHYLRQRLRRTAGRISDMAAIKTECDRLAHKSAQRMALGGFGALMSWWVGVYYLTFQTDLGWDTMEPVTYLVGLSGLMGGYIWFLYHNREVSYRAALNLTVSRRQAQLYKSKGFDEERWEALVKDGNELRREIKDIATQYDVEWDEKKDEKDQAVTDALKKEREQKEDEGDEGKKDEHKAK